MKDFLGHPINVGDVVVAAVTHGRNSGASLAKFTVTGFTEKFVKGEIPDYCGNVNIFHKLRTSPKKLIVIKYLESKNELSDNQDDQ